jgi:dihydroorotase-like cyclic amidohydrolase
MTDTAYDLAIEGGTLVSGAGRQQANLYVSRGQVREVAPRTRPAWERVEATGLLVMPGFVDVHVHFMDPADPSREDFPSGSAAAARAGVTTVVEHTHARPVRSAADLVEKAEYLADRWSTPRLPPGSTAWRGRVGWSLAPTPTSRWWTRPPPGPLATLLGRPLRTYVRGQLVALHGAVCAKPGAGRFVLGPGAV